MNTAQVDLLFLTERNSTVRFIQVKKAIFDQRRLTWQESRAEPVACYVWNEREQMVSCYENKEFTFFAYGESGQKLSCFFLDELEKIIGSEAFEYREDNRLSQSIRRYFPTSSQQIYSYSYDDEHGITAAHSDNEIRLEKRDSHQRIYKEYFYRGKELQLVKNYQYDAENRFKSISICDSDSTVHREIQYSHDDTGRLVSRVIYDSHRIKISDEHYAYGKSENPEEEINADWQERVTWIPDGKKEGSRRPLEVFYRTFTSSSAEIPLLCSPPQTLTSPAGFYRGELSRGVPEGKGNFTFTDGRRFEGQFRNGIIEGKGSLTWPDNLTIRGYFRDGLAEGIGECLWEDGRRYEGEFQRGKMHGKGIFSWPDGNRFHGIFENGTKTENGYLEKEYPEADSNG